MREGATSRTRSPERIVVHGPSGSGKSTLARELASALAVPYLELDGLYHLENWRPRDGESFRAAVASFVTQPRWVVDGNYSEGRDSVWSRADFVVVIDLPRRIVTWRVFRRTLRRGLRREVLWNGNRERLRTLLSHDPEHNIVLWSWRTHARFHYLVPGEVRRDAPHAALAVLTTRRAVRDFCSDFLTN